MPLIFYENMHTNKVACEYRDDNDVPVFRIWNVVFKSDPLVVYFPHPVHKYAPGKVYYYDAFKSIFFR